MLEVADELAHFQRYLGPEEEKECHRLERLFEGERRKFVYDLVKEERSLDEQLALIDRDLDRIAQSGNHYDFAIEHVRDSLHQHVTRQMGSSTLMRMVTRWGPPVGVAVATMVVIYLRTLQ